MITGILAELADVQTGPGGVLSRVAEAVGESGCGVLIDEAHHLASWPEAEQLELREFLRADTRIGVIVASSEASALASLTNERGPLRYVGQRFPLPPIDRGDWEHALRQRFAHAEVPITEGALALLLAESRGHPYCTMLLARESARIAQPLGEVSDVIVQAALLVVVEDEAWSLRDDVD
jgi:hypothetical protein